MFILENTDPIPLYKQRTSLPRQADSIIAGVAIFRQYHLSVHLLQDSLSDAAHERSCVAPFPTPNLPWSVTELFYYGFAAGAENPGKIHGTGALGTPCATDA